MYILKKYVSPHLVQEIVSTLLLIVDVADVLRSDIRSALASEMNDYEDAVQSACAKRAKANYIITRNLKDFKMSVVPAISPYDALKILLTFI